MTDAAHATIRPDGTGTLVLKGKTYRITAPDVGTARERISARLREHAHVHGPLRAHVHDPDGSWALDIAPDGRITEAGGQDPDEADEEADEDTAEIAIYTGPSPATDDTLESRLFGGYDTEEPPPRKARAPRLPRRLPSPSGRTVAAAACAVVLVAGSAAAVVWVANDSPDSSDAPALSPVQGWTGTPTWTSPQLAETTKDTAPVLVTDQTVTTTVRGDDGPTLAALNARDGDTLWTHPLTEPLTTSPHTTTYDGKPSIAAATAHSLTIWPRSQANKSPKPKTWTFTEAGVEPVPQSPMPLLANEATATALTVKDGQVVRRLLPGGAEPVAALEDGVVIAVEETGHWWALQSETKRPAPNMLEPPAWGSQVQSVLGMAGDTLVVSWTRTDNTRLVAGYDARKGMRPTWQTIVPARPEPETMTVSPDKSWAVVGATSLDMDTGRSRALPADWKTLRITDDAAWSKKHVANKLQPAVLTERPVTARQTIPVATVKGNRGIVTAHGRIHALEDDPDLAYDAGEPAKPPKKPTPTETTPSSKKKPTATSKAASPAKKRSTPQKETAPTTKSWKTR